MPDLLERMYCAQQINIPPNLPFILKQYAKAAIRSQPYDLLLWSAAYFRAKANNTPPPVKERLEYPPIGTPSRLSPGFLKVLHKQLGENDFVAAEILYEKWVGVCLVKESLDAMLRVGDMKRGNVPWLKFVAVAAGFLSESLSKTMVLVCEVLTEEPEGGSAMIPVELFTSLYQFLARLDCGPLLPEVKTIEGTIESSSGGASDVSSQTSTHDEYKQETYPKVEGVSDKDSSAGLMVWPDIKPIEKPDEIKSPKYSEEDGALSDVGIEVLDDAQGPVTEVLTLYPAHSQIQSDTSVTYTPLSKELVKSDGETDGTILSQLSLKENREWIKLEKRPDETILLKEEYSEDVGVPRIHTKATEADDSDKTAVHNIHGQLSSSKSINEILEVKKFADESEDNASERDLKNPEGKASSEGKHGDGLLDDSESVTEPRKEILRDSPDICVSETVTVSNFFTDGHLSENGSKSIAEIRKGVCGQKSGQHLERDSSENTVKGAMTVFKLVAQEESSVIVNQEKQAREISKVQSSSDKCSSESESHASSLEISRLHIPGIGPVIPETDILAVLEYMQHWAAKQHGMVMPRNINHTLCPPLDLPPYIDQSEDSQSRY